MNVWTLIYVIYYFSSAATGNVLFTSEQACKSAIVRMQSDFKLTHGAMTVAVCVPRGDQ